MFVLSRAVERSESFNHRGHGETNTGSQFAQGSILRGNCGLSNTQG